MTLGLHRVIQHATQEGVIATCIHEVCAVIFERKKQSMSMLSGPHDVNRKGSIGVLFGNRSDIGVSTPNIGESSKHVAKHTLRQRDKS